MQAAVLKFLSDPIVKNIYKFPARTGSDPAYWVRLKMDRFFHRAYRHLWYLAGLAGLGMLVLGFVYEQLSSPMIRVAMLGFSAAIVHASAWWFAYHTAAPWKKFLFCAMLFAGVTACGLAGRLAYFKIANEFVGTIGEEVRWVVSLVPAWWLVSVVVNGLVKLSLRWHLIHDHVRRRPSLTVADLFQLTAIVGVIGAAFNPEILTMQESGYGLVLLGSLILQVTALIPIAALTLRPLRSAVSKVIVLGASALAILLLVLAAMLTFLSDDFEAIAAVAVGLVSLIFPFYVMLLAARENHLNIVSDWFADPSL